MLHALANQSLLEGDQSLRFLASAVVPLAEASAAGYEIGMGATMFTQGVNVVLQNVHIGRSKSTGMGAEVGHVQGLAGRPSVNDSLDRLAVLEEKYHGALLCSRLPEIVFLL